MIVKDKAATLATANEISSILLNVLGEEAKKQNFEENDPSEAIYLLIHTMASLYMKTCLSVDGYGKVYGIEGLSVDKTYDWVALITKELIAAMAKEQEKTE